MSAIFQIRCETCDERGPKIRRSGGTTLCSDSITGPFDAEFKTAADEAWTRFLLEHEFHDLRLVTGP
jgi:hypothetical protein